VYCSQNTGFSAYAYSLFMAFTAYIEADIKMCACWWTYFPHIKNSLFDVLLNNGEVKFDWKMEI
jgi:hypothetical protein